MTLVFIEALSNMQDLPKETTTPAGEINSNSKSSQKFLFAIAV